MSRFRILLVSLWIATLALPTVIHAQYDTIMDVVDRFSERDVAGDSKLTMLNSVLTGTDFEVLLSGRSDYTVFAPADGGFETLFARESIDMAMLTGNLPLMRTVLGYHVVEGLYPYDMLVQLSESRNDAVVYLTTISGEELKLQVDRNERRVRLADGQASIVVDDITTGNGVVHIIDNVLIPADDVRLGTVQISEIMLPTTDYTAGSISDLLTQNADLSLLLEALERNEIAPLLGDPVEGDFTLFAPTNAALTALAAQLNMSFDDLVKTPFMENVLWYHLTDEVFTAESLVPQGASAIPTLGGNLILVTMNGETVVLNSVIGLSVTDISATNGMIHVIDGVMLPGIR